MLQKDFACERHLNCGITSRKKKFKRQRCRQFANSVGKLSNIIRPVEILLLVDKLYLQSAGATKPQKWTNPFVLTNI